MFARFTNRSHRTSYFLNLFSSGFRSVLSRSRSVIGQFCYFDKFRTNLVFHQQNCIFLLIIFTGLLDLFHKSNRKWLPMSLSSYKNTRVRTLKKLIKHSPATHVLSALSCSPNLPRVSKTR